MSSPFPGMDPYLEDERLWPAFQHQLVSCLYQILLPGLVERYRAFLHQRTYTDEAAVPRAEEYVEIRERGTEKLVTLLDVVSPANRSTVAGRQVYLKVRREAGPTAGANLVEIDLVLQGQPMLEYSRDGLPGWDYAVTVTRATRPDRHEIYTSTLHKPLPRFRLPLAADDRDTVLNLQAAFGRAFDQGDFAGKIDYHRDPPTALAPDRRDWLHSLLVQSKLREGEPARNDAVSHEAIAHTAYLLWMEEGCPHGRDREHWLRAEEQVKRASQG